MKSPARYSTNARRPAKKLERLLVLVLLVSSSLSAQKSSTASHVIQLQVRSLASLKINNSPKPLVIASTNAAWHGRSAEDRSTSYSLSSNRSSLKLSASINEPLPEHVYLFVTFASSRGTSAGHVDLSNALTPVNVVTGIGAGSDLDQEIAYRFLVDKQAGVRLAEERIITFTVTD